LIAALRPALTSYACRIYQSAGKSKWKSRLKGKNMTLAVSVTMMFTLVLGLAMDAMAAHPFAGTWKMNVEQSEVSPSQPFAPKDWTIVVREVGDQLEGTDTGTLMKDGSAIVYKWVAPRSGGVVRPGGEPFGHCNRGH
jgi:hypothetical protein